MKLDRDYFIYNKKKLVKLAVILLIAVVAFVVYMSGAGDVNDDFSLTGSDGELLSGDAGDGDAGAGDSETKEGEESADEGAGGELAAKDEPVTIIVDVDGAVVSPGVVELSEGARVYEAIEKAGGLTSEADTTLVNKAEGLSDGDKIYIPFKEKEASSKVSSKSTGKSSSLSGVVTSKTGKNAVSASISGEAESGSGLININTADSDKLQQLKGVGPSTAEKIISYRQQNGSFGSIEELMNVSGIGQKTFDSLKDNITI